MPDRRMRKLRATRSPSSSRAAGPTTAASTVLRLHHVAVIHPGGKDDLGVQVGEHGLGHRQAGHHQFLLGPDVGLGHDLRVDGGLGGDIPGADVLFQGQVDEAVDGLIEKEHDFSLLC